MAKGKLHHQMSEEEREKEAREYVEAQQPIVQEQPANLNKPGESVPDTKAEK